MDSMEITSVQYSVSELTGNSLIRATIDGINMAVPLDPANRHYAEIMRQVEAGELVIQEAE